MKWGIRGAKWAAALWVALLLLVPGAALPLDARAQTGASADYALSPLVWEYMWSTGAVLNQRDTPRCAGYGWATLLGSYPFSEGADPDALYFIGQGSHPDPTQGSNPFLIADYLKAQGLIGEWGVTRSEEEAIRWVETRGPILLVTPWYSQMSYPDASGHSRIGGSARDWHTLTCYAYDGRFRDFGCQNTWGAAWGDAGKLRLWGVDLAQLIRGGALIIEAAPRDTTDNLRRQFAGMAGPYHGPAHHTQSR